MREQAGGRLWRVDITPQTSPAALLTSSPHPQRVTEQAHVIPPDEPMHVPMNPCQLPGVPSKIPPDEPIHVPTSPRQLPGVPSRNTAIPHNDLGQDEHQAPQPTMQLAPTTRAAATTYYARAYNLPSVPDLIAFLHATAGYPVKQTWVDAIKRGAYNTWPGLTPQLAARYCPMPPETLQGHMAQPHQHI